MPANNDPIFSKIGDVSTNSGTGAVVGVVTATGDYTGVSTNHKKIHTAGSMGSYVQRIRCKATGTNTASVLRIYLNNGTDQTTATNNSFYGEISLPATTAINTAATMDIDYPMNIALPAGWTIWVGVGTTVAASWVCTAIAGVY